MKTVAVLGASADRAKFSNQAVRAYQRAGFTVYPINPREVLLEGLVCYPNPGALPGRPQRFSVYLPPPKVLELLPAIAARGCDELWLNPGTESPAVLEAAAALGLNVIQACSLRAMGGPAEES